MIPPPVARLLIRIGLPALALMLLVVGFRLWLADVKRDARRDAVAQERAGTVEHMLNQMEKADDARRQIRDDRSPARHDECMRSARTPENCQRFLPE